MGRWPSILLLGVSMVACSDSTAPKPTILGTWHARITGMSLGTIEPDTFTFVITQVEPMPGGVIMPTSFTWLGPYMLTYDGQAGVGAVVNHPEELAIFKIPRDFTHCQSLQMIGTPDAADDSVTSGQVGVFGPDATTGNTCTNLVATGTISMTR